MTHLPADLRLRRELIERVAAAPEARMEGEESTLRQAAGMLSVSHPGIADLLAKRAERDALVRQVYVKPGQTVAAKDLLIELD